MPFIRTTALERILKLTARIRIVQGGSSAGKTIAVLMSLIDTAQSKPNLTISVVSESMPHLRTGAIKDFLNIMRQHGYYEELAWNRTINTYRFDNGSVIEFFSADTVGKVHGPRRDILYINECNNIPFEIYRQLALRTAETIWLDYNPVTEFWVHERLMDRDNSQFLKLTYLDNEGLSPSIVQELESYKGDENFWRVYGLGETGTLEGLILTNWEIIDELPKEARLVRHVVDFGYTTDPSHVANIYEYNGGFVIDELLHEKGQTNKQLANVVRADEGLGPVDEQNTYTGSTQTLLIADSAEPKSIDEIKGYGVMIAPSTKGQGSVNQGLQAVQSKRIYFTKRSTEAIKAARNYQWKTDKTGKSLNVPEHKWSHGPDAWRYGIVDVVGFPSPDKDAFGVAETSYGDSFYDDYEHNSLLDELA